jgi:hypothetical protein
MNSCERLDLSVSNPVWEKVEQFFFYAPILLKQMKFSVRILLYPVPVASVADPDPVRSGPTWSDPDPDPGI